MVLDVSTSGVFVQTTVSFRPGTDVSLTIYVPGGRMFALEGQVARVVESPVGLKAEAGCGLAVALRDPPAAYVAWVNSLVQSNGKAQIPQARQQSFRVQLKQMAGNETHTVLVRCGSEAEASEHALAEMDDDWKVLSVEPE
jgi:hypothetical protein